MKLTGLILALVILGSVTACKTGKSLKTTELKAELADSVRAVKWIQENDADRFFDLISVIDMAIQMQATPPYKDRQAMVGEYKDFLATQVMQPTAQDQLWVDSTFLLVRKELQMINPVLNTGKINIVKIRTDHYGEGTFYTRGHSIFIPDHIFSEPFDQHVDVMLHEYWHIISRNNPAIKKEAYELIGFVPHGKNLQFSDSLSKTLLTNPDGCVSDYTIQLNGEKVLPLLTSKFSEYMPGKTTFFQYLQFDFYPISETGRVGDQPAKLASMAGLFEKITDNTQYIIHPDEITADNFKLAVEANATGNYSSFSEAGKKLIDKFSTMLKNIKEVH